MGGAPEVDARIFEVTTRFQRMAKRAGGVPRDKAIERAEAQIEEVKPGFDDWLDRELLEFDSLIKRAEDGNADRDWIAQANFRSRQLRDSAMTFGFELLSFIANSLCEVLDAIEADDKFNMETITCHLDALKLARKKSYRRLSPDQVPELTKGLSRVVKHVTLVPAGA